jgi:hypothetical protein
VVSQLEKGGLFVEGEVVLDGLEGQSAVHGPGFKIEETETAREVGGEGTLARASGAVDGDDRPLTLGALRLRGFAGLRHSADLPFSGLNLRAGARLPKGFLLPLNLSKVLTGFPD